FTRGPESDVW
nr:immunoglobulin heavy chain junction region [Macaca mulatta]